jgi:putative transposase
MYRIARAAGQTRERRAQATHPPRVRPELVAHGPSQVWSWDITALKGPRKGEWYKLYVVIDIFSRYVTGWLVANAEDAIVAKDFLTDAVARNHAIPHTIHADRGGSMTSKPVSPIAPAAAARSRGAGRRRPGGARRGPLTTTSPGLFTVVSCAGPA